MSYEPITVPDYSVSSTELDKAVKAAKAATLAKRYDEARVYLNQVDQAVMSWKIWLGRQR